MEYRRVQTSGKASYILCLPKNWIEENRIKKGDLVSVKYVDGDLVISKVQKNKREKEKPFHKIVVDNLPYELLTVLIQGAYIDGFDNLEIVTTKKEMDPSIKRLVIDTIQDLIGFEVTSDSKNSIIIENISEPSEFNVKKVVDQLFRLSYEMKIVLLEALIARDPKIVENIETMKRMVNRLNLLSQRLINMGIHNNEIARKIGIEGNIYSIHLGNIIRLLNWNTATMLEMAQQVEIINSFKIPDKLLELYKTLPMDREIPHFKESEPSHKRSLEFDITLFQTVEQLLRTMEEIRKKAAEEPLEPKLRVHLENFNSMLQSLYENTLKYVKEILCIEHFELTKQ
ncbi:MAG: phosphate uptake regulator PhoU [Candidatus Jordarchaeaceae archaeon]